MKAKPLIGENDYVTNPSGYFGSKIPWFYPTEGKYAKERGHMNYGVFRATEYANRKAGEVLDALVTFFYEEDQGLKNAAYEELCEIAKKYHNENQ
jgi:hypothetical protein